MDFDNKKKDNMTFKATTIKPVNKGSIVCKFDIEIPEMGMTIRECTLIRSKDREWVSMPSRAYDVNGEKKYFSYIFCSQETLAKVNKEVIPQLSHGQAADELYGDVPF